MQEKKQVVKELGGDELSEFLNKYRGFNISLTDANVFCYGSHGAKSYGLYVDDKMVSMVIVSVVSVFPMEDNPNGKIGHISGLYTIEDERHNGCAKLLLQEIKKLYGIGRVDFLCCDAKIPEVFEAVGFKAATDKRLWTGKPV